MKKSYLILAAVAGLFASCAQNEDLVQIADEPVAIGFESGFIDNLTRAELNNSWFTTANNSFGVFGYKGTTELFGTSATPVAEQVTWDGTKNDWVNTTLRFWDKAADDYSFYAYAPYASTSTTYAFSSSTKNFTFTRTKSTTDNVDVITNMSVAGADVAISTPLENYSYANCCTNTTNGHGSGHVEFTFNHIYSKLAFKAYTSVDPTKATIKITSIDLDFPTMTSATWAQDRTGNTYHGATTFTGYTAATGVSGNATDGFYVSVADSKDANKFKTSVYSNASGSDNLPYKGATPPGTPIALGDQFVVIPVGTNAAEHIFGVKVTYTITYADSKVETGCIATGVVGGGSATENQYKPTQNSSYIVTIDVNPAQIQFCVNSITDWDTDTAREVVVE